MNLFNKLPRGQAFHFYDKPKRGLVKEDENHYITDAGRRIIHPHVLVFEEVPKTEAKKWKFSRR